MSRLLIIEDDSNIRFGVGRTLAKAGHSVAEAGSLSEGRARISEEEFDLIITDVHLGDGDGVELVHSLREEGFVGGVIVVTAYASVEHAVGAMRLGADDYIQKPLRMDEIISRVERVLEHQRDRRRLKLYERMDTARADERGLLGSSEAWRRTMQLAERLAQIPLAESEEGAMGSGGGLPTILLTGETGTGKGVLARYIHDEGIEGDHPGPFVHINCSALPAALVEGELFGHEKGAFTDARESREGLFEMAEGGTVFLDEIGEMPPELQAKLLTVVEDGTFRRVGGVRTKRVRTRVIAATNQDLESRVMEGKFRRDLFYRLSTFVIDLPPVRERGDDGVEIAEAMVQRYSRRYGRQGVSLTEDAVRAIREHDWPGNVRELMNVIQRAVLLCDGARIGAEGLGLLRVGSAGQPAGGACATAERDGAGAWAPVFDFERGVHTIDGVERTLIMQALRATGGNISRTARLINMHRSSVRNRIARYGLDGFVREVTNQ